MTVPLFLFIQTGHQDAPCVVAHPRRQNQHNQSHVTGPDQSKRQTQHEDALRERTRERTGEREREGENERENGREGEREHEVEAFKRLVGKQDTHFKSYL